MQLLLVRHAEAIPADGGDDARRSLSARGCATAERVAALLLSTGLAPDSLVSSPRVRTRQTADIFARTLGFRGDVELMPSLCFTRPATLAASELRAKSGCVCAFGHMPTLAEISNQLCRGRGLLSFATSEVLLIEGGRAIWSIDPQALKLVHA